MFNQSNCKVQGNSKYSWNNITYNVSFKEELIHKF